MRAIVTIQHPAHVHFYRHVIDELEARGHGVFVFARENDLAVPLLEHYDIDHEVLASSQESIVGLVRTQLTYELRLLRRARTIDPDVMTAIGGVAVSHVAHLVGARSVVFLDNEGVTSHRITTPFAHVVCTPRAFREEYGDTHRRYDGYQELAYLHPARFDPSPDRLRAHGVEPDERYSVLRFRTWDALHDVGEAGLSPAGKRRLVDILADHGEVYITSSDPLPSDLEPYRLPVPTHLIHDLLYYADCYAGDSATMATEAGVLATPAVRIQSFATGDREFSNFVELEERYGLVRSTADERDALELVATLVADPETTAIWRARRERLLGEKIDVTSFVVEVLEAQAGERVERRRRPANVSR
ncbi:DUF354 domain-containing protein [Natrialbaceae archaeon AArc-T1-2]|uniref:DUF354 domain-containing protein n=1 Tax=Natrialbaceae archaeon AArc-T1-2 TaxID=3053904 RepID=UPI00255ACF02|nr:DUF354 domain-containing protein [Natrialbaceae archaeon AArc-T1-2]WIV66207.1 DUF354 domain-containing protein [Natrialbaceae archaeon AArc-T1-2]